MKDVRTGDRVTLQDGRTGMVVRVATTSDGATTVTVACDDGEIVRL